MTDQKRACSSTINNLLEMFPVVLLVGARQTGKTTLAKMGRVSWKYYDLENAKDYDFVSRDFEFFFKENSQQIIIDEAQELPQIFKELRGVVDAQRELRGRFILTGSSSPELLKEAADSLAGRVAIVEVGIFKMNEFYGLPVSPFYQIFQSTISKKETLEFLKEQGPSSKIDVFEHFLKGGYPEPRLNPNKDFYFHWMENYYQTYINRDVKKLFPKLDSIRYRRFIDILSSLSGTIINKAEVGRSIDCSEVTIRDYLEIAHATFVWRMIPSFENCKIKSTTKLPKGIFRDSGLAHYLSGIQSKDQLMKAKHVGASFEGFIIEEIILGLNSINPGRWNYYYYRTRSGSEVDLILQGPFGIVPIEIKFGMSTTLKQLTSIRKFVQDNQLPFGILINNSNQVKMLCDEVIQIPAAFL